ncbi:UNVERIFIED_CONTAM: hypothetical protein FKN15_073769 [Acipenser sinensis]
MSVCTVSLSLQASSVLLEYSAVRSEWAVDAQLISHCYITLTLIYPCYQLGMSWYTGFMLQAQKVRLARCQDTYYGGSLPNVNQIGNSTSEFQLRSSSNMMKFTHLVAWSRIFLFSLLQCPLNSVLVSVSLCLCAVYPYPVPPIEENMLDERKQLLKPWDTKKFPILSSRPKSCEVPGIKLCLPVMQPLLLFSIFPSPEQHSSSALIPTALNTGGSLPDLTSLHFPSPLPTPLDPDEPHFPSLSGGSSTGNLASTLTQLGFGVESAFHSQGLYTEGWVITAIGPILPFLQHFQLEQFNMESPAGSLSLSNNSSGGGGFPGELRGQTFSPAESGRLWGSHSNLQDPQLLNKQKQSCTGGRHGNVPSIILTGVVSAELSLRRPLSGDAADSQADSSSLPTGTSSRAAGVQTASICNTLEQFNMESPAGSLSLSNNSSGGGGFPGELRGQTFSPAESGRLGGSHSNLQDPQLLNKQKQSCTGGRHGNVPSIILTGDSPPGLSKEIASALAGVPGFDFGQFSLDDALRMEPLALEGLGMLGEADLVLPDPSVEESFRSDRLK